MAQRKRSKPLKDYEIDKDVIDMNTWVETQLRKLYEQEEITTTDVDFTPNDDWWDN